MATSDPDRRPPSFGLYVHVPYCTAKCPYCEFSTAPYVSSRVPAYLYAIAHEARTYSPRVSSPFTSVFIGGGTPSLLSGDEVHALMASLRDAFSILPDAEVTIEANPESLDAGKLEGYLDAGVTRLSIGVQSFDDELLGVLGREHLAADGCAAIAVARSVGFRNVSVDIMFGAPTARPDQWRRTVEQAVGVDADHLSVYGMTLEPVTVFGRQDRKAPLDLPDEDVQAEMYEWAMDELAQAGYRQYEISNFARPGFECRHNITYWLNEPYVGLGASAWGYLDGERYGNVRGAQSYVQRISSARSAVVDRERLIGLAAKSETVTLGLRMTEGVDSMAYQQRHGTDLVADFGDVIGPLVDVGCLSWKAPRLKMTRRGLLLANEVSLRFLP